jgi:molybdenum cofactor cytidylyltransferase
MIAAVVLAAGFARRMGRQKLLLELEGKPVVRWSVETVLPHVEDCVVVTGQDDAAVRAALGGLAVRFAINTRPQDGQGSSIAVGIAALGPSTVAALIVLGDQPRTPADVVPALLATRVRTAKAIVTPSYRGTPGTPVLFSSETFPELRALRGDAGARVVVAARPERVETLALDMAMPADVDTPEDFTHLMYNRDRHA